VCCQDTVHVVCVLGLDHHDGKEDFNFVLLIFGICVYISLAYECTWLARKCSLFGGFIWSMNYN